MMFSYPVHDVHIHVFSHTDADHVLSMTQEAGIRKFCLASVSAYEADRTANNLACALTKARSGGRAHALGGFHYPETGIPDADQLLEQAKRLHAMGFDGIKMLDGKPTMRRRVGVPLCDPVYDPMLSYLEAAGLPLLYHVGDPWEFWHWERMPQWAKRHGRELFYGEGGYPAKEALEDETRRMLDKHPRLRVILAHFFFTSTDMALSDQMFDTYPNLYYDITPGWEMFESFAQDYDAWRAFFSRRRGRIVFGSDTYSDHWRQTLSCMRRVLETDESFTAFEEDCRGLRLDEEILLDLYQNNYEKFLPLPPRALDRTLFSEYSDDVLTHIDTFREADRDALRQEVLAARDALLAAL